MLWETSSVEMMDNPYETHALGYHADAHTASALQGLFSISSPRQLVEFGQRTSGADVVLLVMPETEVFVGTEYRAAKAIGGAIYRSMETGEVDLLSNRTCAAEAGYQTYVAAPVRSADATQIGTIVMLYRDDRPVSDKDISTLKLLASAASSAR